MPKIIGILLKEAEFLATDAIQLSIEVRWARIFGKGGENGATELQTAGIGRALQPADNAKSLRIAFVALEVGFLDRREIMPFKQAGMAKPFANGIFAGMAERWIADVVSQAGGGNDSPEITRLDVLQAMPGNDFTTHHGAQRTPDTTDFKAVCQAGADIVALGERENLCLVLHAPEGGGEDDAVVILLKGCTFRCTGRLAGTQPFARQQFFPDFSFAQALQFRCCNGLRVYSASSTART